MKKISRRSFLTAMAAVSAAGVLAACGASSSTASSVASSVAASSETAASSEAAPESVTIKAFNGAKELVDVEVPFDPQRIAILDLGDYLQKNFEKVLQKSLQKQNLWCKRGPKY